MKRRFTILTAALALLVSLAIPMGMWGQTTYEQLTSIANIDESAQYVLGIDGTGFHYEGTSSWGKTALPSAQTPIYYTLTKATDGNSFTAHATISGTTYYLQIPTSNTFSMATSTGTNTDIIIGTTQVSGTNYAVANKTTTTRHLRINGTSGLRSYAGTTGTMAFFYKVVTSSSNTYTVTFDAGEGTFAGNTDFPNASNTVVAGTYTLPSATPAEGYVFNGWALGENTYEGGANYTVSGNADFVASYTENTTPTPGGETATLNIQAYAEANEWVSGTKYATATVAPVTFTANGGGNTGKYYSNGQDWRFYQNESASITISVAEGYTLVSVKPTYTVSNGGVLKNGDATIASGTTVSVSGTSVTFTVGNSGSATNGQVRFTNIDVVYVSNGGTQTASDLTITNQSTDLTFDLYNNTTAQVISYTTSSTGAITITPAESIYFSYVHDATAKTITVTPLAVTPSAQTVTIDQEADDNYYGGTATFTVSVVNSDPNLPGTENNPYTVAQARAAIDANMGTQNVYATGIVSAIPTAYNSTYGNITFNMVDETGDEVFLQAYRCGGDEAANVTVGDVAVVYGDLTKYGSTYEFGQGCTLVSLTHPVITEPTITVNPDVVDVDALLHTVQLPITYSNIVVDNYQSFGVQFYDAEGEETEMPNWLVVMVTGVIGGNDDEYVVTCAIPANQGEAHSTYLKVYAYDAGQNKVYSNLITISQAAPTYAELPFEFNGGTSDIEDTDGLYQEGLGDYSANTNPTTKLKFDSTDDWLLLQFNERPGTLTFDIKNNSFSGGTFKVQTSENGVTFTDLKTYTEISGTQNEEFTNLGENVRYIKWIYTEKVSGNVGLGNIALAEYTEPQQYTLTVEPFENLELITFVNEEMVMEGDGEIQVNEGDQVMLSVVALEGYEMETLMVNGVNHVNDIADDFTYTFEMPGENVTISATAVEDVPVTPDSWVLTDLADLTENDVFVIVGDNGDTYAMPVDGGGQNGAPAAIAVTVVEGTLSAEPAANLQWNISITDDGYTFYPNGETETWLYCTNSNNGVRVGTNENNVFTMSENGYLYHTATERYIGIYNSQDWRCYTTAGGNIANQTFSFYKKKVEATTETYTLNIVGHKGGKGNYSLIAFPFNSGENGVDPTTIDGMITEAFDLYYFDEAGDDEGKEWINYDPNEFNLVSGKGYLYASQDSTSITFSGMPIEGAEYEVRLAKTENAEWSGWNLVGNPFADIAYVADGRDFYTMNGAGTNLMLATNRSLQPMEGVFVEAESNNEALTFTTVEPNNGKSVLSLNLSNNNGLLDRAMVRFGESRQLHKIQLNPNGTKLYITVDGQEYAVVRSEEVGEVPVSFKAEESGRYTISMSSENVEFAYLHLIDNKANTDVDLLATPSYTFEANAADNANRFRLVFSASNGINESEIFAFFNGNNLVINNEGEATLQIIDMVGRVLSNEQINGSYNNSLNLSAGVYVLRLSNGNTMKTQKIVID